MKGPKAYRERMKQIEAEKAAAAPLSPDPDEVLPGATLAETIDAELDIKTRRERAAARQETESRIGRTDKEKAVTFGFACKYCGAEPPQPTRDGVHTCQCRMEKVKRTED